MKSAEEWNNEMERLAKHMIAAGTHPAQFDVVTLEWVKQIQRDAQLDMRERAESKLLQEGRLLLLDPGTGPEAAQIGKMCMTHAADVIRKLPLEGA